MMRNVAQFSNARIGDSSDKDGAMQQRFDGSGGFYEPAAALTALVFFSPALGAGVGALLR